jgi:hypothetical protein
MNPACIYRPQNRSTPLLVSCILFEMLLHPCRASGTRTSAAQMYVALGVDSGIANGLIDTAVAQYVLPLMPALFADEDPMPL